VTPWSRLPRLSGMAALARWSGRCAALGRLGLKFVRHSVSFSRDSVARLLRGDACDAVKT
jgi:hypothetical protein